MDEDVDGSNCDPRNSPVLIQGIGKQLHGDSVSHQDVLVSWTSRQQGQTLEEESLLHLLEVHVRALQPSAPSWGLAGATGRKLQFALLSGVTEVSGGRVPVPLGRHVPGLSARPGTRHCW